MCTTGAIVLNRGTEKRVYGFKTSDSPWCGYWHGMVKRPDGFDSLGYGLIPQQGINAGMNERGLTVISSYFDYVEPGSKDLGRQQPESSAAGNTPWKGDLRGIVQAEVLAKHGTSKQALDYFQYTFRNTQSAVGGNHVIVDPSGEIYVFEHCRGMTGIEPVSSRGYVVRSNQSMTLYPREQELMSQAAREDRETRLKVAVSVLEDMKQREEDLDQQEVIQMLQSMTSIHNGSKEAPGSICAHGVISGRSNASEPHHTLSALIWDVSNKVMYYSQGNPCESKWESMNL